MKRLVSLSALAALATLTSACVSNVGPVEVTRFHTPETVTQLGQGTISVVPASDEDGNSLEFRTYQAAVMRELETLGYRPASGGQGQYVAVIGFDRFIRNEGGGRSPVSVGVGGSTGSYGSGVGVGVGINLGGGRKATVTSELTVAIRETSNQNNLWEGRAIAEARQGSSAAETSLSAGKLATSLFTNFPGASGQTVEVE